MYGAASLFREALARSGLTARELSRRTGVTEGRISDYLSGRHEPGANRFIQLLRAAGYRIHLEASRDRNGLALAELLDLGDALAVGGETPKPERLPSFSDLLSAHG